MSKLPYIPLGAKYRTQPPPKVTQQSFEKLALFRQTGQTVQPVQPAPPKRKSPLTAMKHKNDSETEQDKIIPVQPPTITSIVTSLNQLNLQMDSQLYQLRQFDGLVAPATMRPATDSLSNRRPRSRTQSDLNLSPMFYQVKIGSTVQNIEFSPELICQICIEPLQKPLLLPCGHKFCALCAQRCSQLWAPLTCPVCAQQYKEVTVDDRTEAKIATLLRQSRVAQLNEVVLTLSSDGRVPAFTFGVVQSIQNGFVSADLTTTVIDDLFGEDETDQYFRAKIATVQGQNQWQSKASNLLVFNPKYFVVGTRLLRGSLVINKQFLKLNGQIVAEPAIFNKSSQQFDQYEAVSLKIPTKLQTVVSYSMASPRERAANYRTDLDDTLMDQQITDAIGKQVQRQADKRDGSPQRSVASSRLNLTGAIGVSSEIQFATLSPLMRQIEDELTEEPELTTDQLLRQIDENAKFLLAEEFVYDPDLPKQVTPLFTPFTISNDQKVSLLLQSEPLQNIHTVLDTKCQKQAINPLNTLRIITDFQFLQKWPEFACSGCKMFLRAPVALECDCQYCMQCARELFRLGLCCLGCGATITRSIGLKHVNKRLILRMYSKIPHHSPLIDKGLPVRVKQQLGILLDDPNRVNVWVLTPGNKTVYSHVHELSAVNLCGLQIAIRPQPGLVYVESQFALLEDEDEGFKYYSLDQLQGVELVEDAIYSCMRLVEDLREQIVVAKIEGTKMQQQIEMNEIKKRKKNIIIEKEERNKPNAKPITKQEGKVKVSKETIERRKKLHLVGFDNPDAATHPGNIMVYDIDKKEEVQKPQVQTISSVVPTISATFLANKPYLVQICYLHPRLNFICSACWNVLRRPLQLSCGHVVCRTCACVYQIASIKCLLCHREVKVKETKNDDKLHSQLMKMDERYCQRGIDVGSIISTFENPRLGIVVQTAYNTKLTLKVAFPDRTEWLDAEQLCLLEPDGIVDDDICLGSPVVCIKKQYDDVLGIVVSFPDQKAPQAKKSRSKNAVAEQHIVLKVRLETGVEHMLPLDFLRKVRVKIVEKTFAHYQKEKDDENEAKAGQLDSKAVEEVELDELQGAYQDQKTNNTVETTQIDTTMQMNTMPTNTNVTGTTNIWERKEKREKKKDFKGF